MTMTSRPIRVLLADDHPVVLRGLVALLSARRNLAVVATAGNGKEAVMLFEQHRPDVSVLDLRMPVMNGLEALARIRAIDAEARVIMLSTFGGEEDVYRAAQEGVRGYLLKEAGAEEIIAAVQRVHEGQRYFPAEISGKLAEHLEQSELTKREVDVLTLASAGAKNKQIAARLHLTEGTVKTYMVNVLLKLGANDRTEAVMIGLRRGIIHIDAM